MKVLIIGSRGFTGRHLMERLRGNSAFTPIVSADYGVDLRRKETIARALDAIGPDAVINLGAVSFIGSTDLSALFDVNAFGHLNLLESLAEKGFSGKLLFASSANIYGNNTRGVLREDRCPDPANPYAMSKLLAENFCKLFADRLEIVIVRPFSCIGLGQDTKFLVPKIVECFKSRRRLIELGNIDVERDFVDIRDVAAAYERLLTASHPPSQIHISSGEVCSIRRLIDILSEITGHKVDIQIDPVLVRPNDLFHQQGDATRLAALGFKRNYSIRDTLGWMVQS